MKKLATAFVLAVSAASTYASGPTCLVWPNDNPDTKCKKGDQMHMSPRNMMPTAVAEYCDLKFTVVVLNAGGESIRGTPMPEIICVKK